MIQRLDQHSRTFKRPALNRRKRCAAVGPDAPTVELALTSSNGYVTVEISHRALESYIDATGDVPLPVVDDEATGERRVFDARNNVRVVYDASSKLREVATRSGEGLFVRINFTD